jgi:hypothetical protein
MDEPDKEEATATEVPSMEMNGETIAQLMKYAEAIDWKLWEILKLMRKQAGEDQE